MKPRATPRFRSTAERCIHLRHLDRRCEEYYGLDQNHELRRTLRRLEVVWNPDLYRWVQRALKQIDTQRAACRHMTKRIPPSDVLSGDIPLGTVVSLSRHPVRFHFPVNRLVLGTLVVGLIGSGKTHLVNLLLGGLEALYRELRILLFDPNNSYTSLCADPARWLNVPWPDLRLNPLAPPKGVDIGSWIPSKVEQLARGELISARHFLLGRIEELYARWKELDGYPSLFDLRDDLVRRKCRPGSAEERYRQSSLNMLDGRLRAAGDVFNCSEGMESLLLDTRARIDTSGCATETQAYVQTSLCHHDYTRRGLLPSMPEPAAESLVVCEEAQTLLAPPRDGLPLFLELLQRSRSRGIGYVFVCQDLGALDPRILPVIGNLFVFAQSSRRNKSIARDILDLNDRETHLLGELSRGECFVRLVGHEAWPHTFLLRVDGDRP